MIQILAPVEPHSARPTRVYTCLCDICGAGGPVIVASRWGDDAWNRIAVKTKAKQIGWSERLECRMTLLLCHGCVAKRPFCVTSDAGARRSWHATIEEAVEAARKAKGPVSVSNLLRGLTDSEREQVDGAEL